MVSLYRYGIFMVSLYRKDSCRQYIKIPPEDKYNYDRRYDIVFWVPTFGDH